MTPFFTRRIKYPTAGFMLLVLVMLFGTHDRAAGQVGGTAGAYSRMGFGARGMSMGNALTAVTTGDAVGYYNPAGLPFAEYRNVSASFGILSLDRTLNYLSFVQPLGGQYRKGEESPSLGKISRAGLAIGIINSGVSKIDGRGSDGNPTGDLATSENQAFLGFGTQLPFGLAVGVTIKFLYHHLYTDVNSTTFGFDVGALYPVSERVTIGFTARDLNVKYSWDTKAVYGEQGTSTVDRFPQLYTIGGAYKLPDSIGTIAADIEFSNRSTTVLKVGAEVPLMPELTLRAGVDRVDLKEKGNGVRPSAGFTVRKSFDELTPAVTYAFVLEPFATSGMHMISLSVVF